eukprot:CAMPEP_0201529932 /NCGR_PEP_ID=MMETSP0161_2-20130828/43214_1 /ASSEMBLY_ACC=CAM_ASM_000251 /TAXON_ID=180227 /ORGANISM="Neoparamoeba aestuarina, Strain SoJaBio B1-5/56/2" /LENGTH=103 /DNA_ID=CAMNT_0047931997 /DNA_START=35 /DNA_END=347 /DNA_ORIENTATION=+
MAMSMATPATSSASNPGSSILLAAASGTCIEVDRPVAGATGANPVVGKPDDLGEKGEREGGGEREPPRGPPPGGVKTEEGEEEGGERELLPEEKEAPEDEGEE